MPPTTPAPGVSPDLPELELPRCGNCRHIIADPAAPAERGFCRRYPPTVFLVGVNRDPATAKVISNESMGLFPVVALGVVCGEWASVETKQ